LALRLAKQLVNKSDSGGNLVFSPLSNYATLALVAAGARGTALDELLALLGAASRDDLAKLIRGALADYSGSGGPLIAFACSVWHDDAVVLKPVFRAIAIRRVLQGRGVGRGFLVIKYFFYLI
jgi:serpin B